MIRHHFLACLILLASLGTAAAAEPKPNLPGVQADGFAFATVNVAQLWDSDILKPAKAGLMKLGSQFDGDIEKDTGFKLEAISRITLYWPEPIDPKKSLRPFSIVTARKPFERAQQAKAMKAISSEEALKEFGKEIEGVTGKNVYFQARNAVIFIDDTTYIVSPDLPRGSEATIALLKVLAGTTPAVTKGPLADGIAAIEKHTALVAADFAPLRNYFDNRELFPEMKPFSTLIQAERGLITFDFGTTISASAKLTFFDVETAKKAEPQSAALANYATELLKDFRKLPGGDEETKAIVVPIIDFALAAFDKPKIARDGKTLDVTLSREIDAPVKKAIGAFPTWAAVASERMKTMNNLKQLGIAMHNYHDAIGHFPQDIVDQNGKPILSWRVQLLPYVEQAPLANQIDRTKPWNDPANKKFLEEMPEVFQIVGRATNAKGQTYFQSLTAPKLLNEGNPLLVPGHQQKIERITDGSSNTLMIVEGEIAVNWMEPGDITYDPKKMPKLGNPKTGKMAAGFADGSVRWFDLKKLGEKKLHALITVDSGEVVTIDE